VNKWVLAQVQIQNLRKKQQINFQDVIYKLKSDSKYELTMLELMFNDIVARASKLGIIR
jgi:hypothetical protein